MLSFTVKNSCQFLIIFTLHLYVQMDLYMQKLIGHKYRETRLMQTKGQVSILFGCPCKGQASE